MSLDGVETGWAPTLDAWLLLDRGQPDAARAILTVDLDHPLWAAGSTALWRAWYAAAWAEAGAPTRAPDREQRLSSAAMATGDLESVAGLATTIDELRATYQ